MAPNYLILFEKTGWRNLNAEMWIFILRRTVMHVLVKLTSIYYLYEKDLVGIKVFL